MAKKLVATYPILYESKQYEVGEPLPANNHEMTKAWIEAKTAEWQDASENNTDTETNDEIYEAKVQAVGNIENKITEEENNEPQIDKEKLENNKQEPKSKKK